MLKLNLGCCDKILPGWSNVDLVPGPGVDVVADLRERWPWEDSSVDHVLAHDVIEHLPDKIHTMNELWRVLKPGAVADVAVPTTNGPGAWQDPTHVSYWNRNSFLYYTHGAAARERLGGHYGVKARFEVAGRDRLIPTPDGERLEIWLRAVKP